MNHSATPRALALVLGCSWLIPACSERPLADSTTDASSTSTSTTTSSTGNTDTSSLPTTSTPSSTTTTTTTSGTTHTLTSSTSLDFIIKPDDGSVPSDDCTPADQDCPEGEKCIPYRQSEYSFFRCVPVTGDRKPGETCTATGVDATATDDCELGAWCWEIDANNQGTCVELCHGPGEYLSCDDEANFDCLGYSLGSLGFCVPSCDGLLQDCPDDQRCLSHYSTFQCYEGSGLNSKSFGWCDSNYDCAAGHMCLLSSSALECDQDSSCCQLYCDRSDPDFVCPGAGQLCRSLYGDPLPEGAPEEYAHIGVCSLPD